MSSQSTRSWGWPVRGFHWIDAAWVVFAVANLVAMQIWRDWETIPFHFIWVSITLLYGFRVWDLRTTGVVLGAIIVTTGIVILRDVRSGAQPYGELTEVPLMSAMFLAMVWHARRRLAALNEARATSEHNLRLLERERQFVQDASHELKTPITIALGHAELVGRTIHDPASTEDVTVIQEELVRLRRLVERMLLTVSAGDVPDPRLDPVDYTELVAAAFHRWSVTSRRWRMSSTPGLWVRGDLQKLNTALDVLLENAVQHTSDRDGIELRLYPEPGEAVLTVSDTGPGIAPSQLTRVFERFARADPGRSRGQGGFGLGLAIARSVAEVHGGTLTATNSPGGGATFVLRVPMIAGPDSDGPAGAGIESPAGQKAEV